LIVHKECPTCGRKLNLTSHHVLPKRFFKNKSAREFRFELCRDCHTELERDISLLGDEKVAPIRYIRKLIYFVFRKKQENKLADNKETLQILRDAQTYFNKNK